MKYNYNSDVLRYSSEIRKLNGRKKTFGYAICNQCFGLFSLKNDEEVLKLNLCRIAGGLQVCKICTDRQKSS